MSIIDQLLARGVIIPRPEAVVVEGVDPGAFEPGVAIHPGTTIVGAASRFGAGTSIGRAGGGYFRDVRAGRGVDLFGGYFDDCVLLDGVALRGHAEVRGGTLLEEGVEAAHHVGFKMTIVLPFVVAGSLINLCDALFSGGTSRKDHSEIGSCLALYNFTPWGDKFASQFGDVPRGVFLRSPRIFLGGQTQVVSPVKVGFGAVIPAGLAVRRSVGEGRMAGERPEAVDTAFDPELYGGLAPKFALTAEYVGNLVALDLWYEHVRGPAAVDAFERALYREARVQIAAGIAERIKRLQAIVDRLPASRARHEQLRVTAPDPALHARRIVEHDAVASSWESWRAGLSEARAAAADPAGVAVLQRLAARLDGTGPWPSRLAALDDAEVARGSAALQRVVDRYAFPLPAA